MGGEGAGFQEVKQAEEFLHTVLQRSARQEDTVFHVQCLQFLKELAVPVLQAMGFIDDHHSPLDRLQLAVIS